MGLRVGPRTPINKEIEAAGTLPDPAFGGSEARQCLKQLIDGKTGRRRCKRHHRWGGISSAVDIGFALSPFILLGRPAPQFFVARHNWIDDAPAQ